MVHRINPGPALKAAGDTIWQRRRDRQNPGVFGRGDRFFVTRSVRRTIKAVKIYKLPGQPPIVLDTISQIVLGGGGALNQIQFFSAGSSPSGSAAFTYMANNPDLVSQEIQDLANGDAGTKVSTDTGVGYIVTNSTPRARILNAAGGIVSIYGYNFASGTLGHIYACVAGTTLTTASIKFNCAFVSSGQINGTWNTNGDNACPDDGTTGCMMFYQDSGGVQSNPIWVTFYP